jgi:integrase
MGSSLTELVDSFALHLRAANLSPRTVRSYCDAVNGPGAFLRDAGLNTDRARRDTAILTIFCDTGARLSEVAGLGLQDVELRLDGHGCLWVLGKGRRPRQLPLDAVAVKACAVAF